MIVRTGNGVEKEDKNTISENDVNENIREDMLFYIEVGLRLFEESKML